MSIILLLVSALCIIMVQINVFNYKFEPFSSEAILNYFSQYKAYSSIFGAFVATAGIFLVISRLGQQNEANKLVIRKEWLMNLESSMNNIKEDSPRMYNYILKIASYDIFDEIYKNSMRVNSKKQIDKIFKTYIKPNVAEFEKTSAQYQKMNGKYGMKVDSYSYNSFSSFVLDLLKPTVSFHLVLEEYFKTIYLAEVEAFKNTLKSD